MKISDFMKLATEALSTHSIPEPEREAEMMLSITLSKKPGEIKAIQHYELPSKKQEYLLKIVMERITTRKHLAYLLKKWEFYDVELTITEDVMVPRPETETLVDIVLSKIRENRVKFIDVGTGSGCISIALLKKRTEWLGIATDTSAAAIKVAQDNAKTNKVAERFIPVISDALNPFSYIDLVVSNPPYVASKIWDTLAPEIHWEPKRAIISGPTGLEMISKIIEQSATRKVPAVVLEFGDTQQESVITILKNNGYSAEIYNDYSGKPRIALGTWEKI